MKLQALLTLGVALLWSCQSPAPPEAGEKDTKETESHSAETDSISYELSNLKRNTPCVAGDSDRCLDLRIGRLKLTHGASSESLARINAGLQDALLATDQAEGSARDAEGLVRSVQEEYQRILEEMPDYQPAWQYYRDWEVYLNRPPLLGVKLTAYSYTGGAHPVEYQFYHLYDTHTGAALEAEDLVKPAHRSELYELAELRFRQMQEIDTSDSYEEAGFWFEEDAFSLPDNFHYSERGLLFHFNPYDIAPYSAGVIHIELPRARIKPWLKPEYRLESEEAPL